ncbi:MAG: hypothetical protein FJZ79_03145 [Chlorobi bacterium]|nr:hypothetical protein [Chlorobiota bacterium]
MLNKDIYRDYFEQILDVHARLVHEAEEVSATAENEALRQAVMDIASFGARQKALAEELERRRLDAA